MGASCRTDWSGCIQTLPCDRSEESSPFLAPLFVRAAFSSSSQISSPCEYTVLTVFMLARPSIKIPAMLIVSTVSSAFRDYLACSSFQALIAPSAVLKASIPAGAPQYTITCMNTSLQTKSASACKSEVEGSLEFFLCKSIVKSTFDVCRQLRLLPKRGKHG